MFHDETSKKRDRNEYETKTDDPAIKRPVPQNAEILTNSNIPVVCDLISSLKINHTPIDNPGDYIRNLSKLHENIPSHIVIEVQSHGELTDFPDGFHEYLKEDVSIFSLASFGECVYYTIDDAISNNQQITTALKHNYPIIPTFNEFHTFLTNPTCRHVVGNLESGNADGETSMVSSIENKKYAYFHPFLDDMLYASENYNIYDKYYKKITVNVIDIRYPKTEKQQDLIDILRIKSTYFSQILHDTKLIDRQDVYNIDNGSKTYVDVMFLSDLITFLKIDYGFEHIIIYQACCRTPPKLPLMQLTQEMKNAKLLEEKTTFNTYIDSNSLKTTWGGRRKVRGIGRKRTRKLRRRIRKRGNRTIRK